MKTFTKLYLDNVVCKLYSHLYLYLCMLNLCCMGKEKQNCHTIYEIIFCKVLYGNISL